MRRTCQSLFFFFVYIHLQELVTALRKALIIQLLVSYAQDHKVQNIINGKKLKVKTQRLDSFSFVLYSSEKTDEQMKGGRVRKKNSNLMT